MKKLLFVMSLVLFTAIGFAKPTQPIESSFNLDSSTENGDEVEYKLTFNCRPLKDSKKVTFRLTLPSDYRMEQGFVYWEGSLPANKTFTRSFVIIANASADKHVSIRSEFLYSEGNTSSTTTTALVSKVAAGLKVSKEAPVKTSFKKRRRRRFSAPVGTKTRK